MTGCAAMNCTNSSEKGFKLFSFPSDKVRREKWIHNMSRKNWSPTRYSRICEKHFEESQFEQRRADGVRKPKPNAIPTLFNTSKPPPRIKVATTFLFKVPSHSYTVKEFSDPLVKRPQNETRNILKVSTQILTEHSYSKYLVADNFQDPKNSFQDQNSMKTQNLESVTNIEIGEVSSLKQEISMLRQSLKETESKLKKIESSLKKKIKKLKKSLDMKKQRNLLVQGVFGNNVKKSNPCFKRRRKM